VKGLTKTIPTVVEDEVVDINEDTIDNDITNVNTPLQGNNNDNIVTSSNSDKDFPVNTLVESNLPSTIQEDVSQVDHQPTKS